MSLLTQTPQARPVGEHSHGAVPTIPDSSRAQRHTSYAAADFPVPTGREEEWRFTPMDRLRGLQSDAPMGEARYDIHADGPAAVIRERVSTSDPRVGSSGLIPADRPGARAWEVAQRAAVLTVPADTELDAPYVVQLRADAAADAPAWADHAVVVAGRHSSSTVVLRYSGSATVVGNLEVIVEDGAQLTLVTVQEWADDTVELARQHARIGRDASLRHIVVTLGGDVVRLDMTVAYDGPGGSFEGLGVYFADAGQHLEHRLFIDHEAPRCRSNVEYKGALQGDSAHTVWIGDVLIRSAAEGTDTYELNRNLVLTEGARADSVPNLEIETGQITRAGHASATGRFDDEQLFYLQARGIPQDVARRLVVRGFFASIVGRIGVPWVVGHIMEAVERELAGGVSA